MRTAHASLEYLLHGSDAGLESMQLNCLARSSNLQKELGQIVAEMVDSEVEAGLVRWLLIRRRMLGADVRNSGLVTRNLMFCNSAARLSESSRIAIPRVDKGSARLCDREPFLLEEHSKNSRSRGEANLILLAPLSSPRLFETNRPLPMQLELFCSAQSAATQDSTEEGPAESNERTSPALPEFAYTGARPLATMVNLLIDDSSVQRRCALRLSAATRREFPRRYSLVFTRLRRLSRHSLMGSNPPLRTHRTIEIISISNYCRWRCNSRSLEPTLAQGGAAAARGGRVSSQPVASVLG